MRSDYLSHAPAPQPAPRPQASHRRRWFIIAVVALVLIIGVWHSRSAGDSQQKAAPAKTTAVQPAAVNQCAGNSLDKLAVISISQRHLWACQHQQVVYQAPVITGMENLEADKSPTGTFHIYAKITNTTLKGSDSTGSWSDPVYYWMPYYDNQYGTYGFHDATWRKDSDFGHVDPYSSNASHGCVELPLAASKWLYNWVEVGTTVTVKS